MTHLEAMAQTAKAILGAEDGKPPEPQEWPKECRCCGLLLSESMWNSLQKRGYMGAIRAGRRLYALELRDCLCRSTLALNVELHLLAAPPREVEP